MKTAFKDADLVSESVPENPEIKKNFYQDLAKVAPAKTIFTTNSSTALPSEYARFTGRPEKFLALHFANIIWDANIGEVMKHKGTNDKIFDTVIDFAREIGMVPVPIDKEQSGYVLNSLLVPPLSASMDLLVRGVSDHETIDKTWMICTKVPLGPFAIMDIVGMNTLFNISRLWGERSSDQNLLNQANYIKKEYIDKGKLGVHSGEGFYKYPNPNFANPDFLK